MHKELVFSGFFKFIEKVILGLNLGVLFVSFLRIEEGRSLSEGNKIHGNKEKAQRNNNGGESESGSKSLEGQGGDEGVKRVKRNEVPEVGFVSHIRILTGKKDQEDGGKKNPDKINGIENSFKKSCETFHPEIKEAEKGHKPHEQRKSSGDAGNQGSGVKMNGADEDGKGIKKREEGIGKRGFNPV